jgi:hypothetical protein
MAYVFASAFTQSVDYTFPYSVTDSDGYGLVMGWWWATSSGTNRTLWRWNRSNGVEVGRTDNAVASTLNVYHDTTGTNGEHNFTNAITTGRWLFIAHFGRWNTVGADNRFSSSYVWVGDTTNSPKSTGPSENISPSISTVGTGSVVTGTFGCIGESNVNGYGWTGYACDVVYYIAKSSDNNNNIFGITPQSSPDAENRTRILNEFVLPHWRGQQMHPDLRRVPSGEGFIMNIPLFNNTRIIGLTGGTLNGFATASGPTVTSAQRNPRPVKSDLYPPLQTRRSGRLR